MVTVLVEPGADGGHRALVHLWRRGRSSSGEKYQGTADGPDAVRAAAEATLVALRRALTGATRVEHLTKIEVFEGLGAQQVGVALSARYRGELLQLQGFCRVRGLELPAAAARAVLDATNRLLDIR